MEENTYYHVYNRGNNRQNIFFEHENYLFFLKKYKIYLSSHVNTFAYCLMPNHFHFFISVKEMSLKNNLLEKPLLTPIEKAFRDFFISYSKSINNKYDRSGSLFQYKFKRKPITSDAYFSTLIAYIHANPVKAGLCKNYEDWKYSSYSSLISSKPTLLEREEVLKWFYGKDYFIKFHKEKLDEGAITNFIFD